MCCIHFIGFKDDRYWNAVKVWGKPDFYHRYWDYRAQSMLSEGGKAIFAKGDEHAIPNIYSFNDSQVM